MKLVLIEDSTGVHDLMDIFVKRTIFQADYSAYLGEEPQMVSELVDQIMSGDSVLILLDNDFPQTSGREIMQQTAYGLINRANALTGSEYVLNEEITDFQLFFSTFGAQLAEVTNGEMQLGEIRILGISEFPDNQTYIEHRLQGKRHIIPMLTSVQKGITGGEQSLHGIIDSSQLLKRLPPMAIK